MDNKNPVLSKRLCELTSETGKSSRKIADEIGIKDATFNDWRCGKVAPRADSILLLCKYFDVSADYLLGLSNVRKVDSSQKAAVDYTGLTQKAAEKLNDLSLFDAALWDIDDKAANYSLSMLLESDTMLEIVDNIHGYYFSCNGAKKQRERIMSTLREQKSKGKLYEYLLNCDAFRDSFIPEDCDEIFDESEDSDIYRRFKSYVDLCSINELCDFVIMDENEGYDDKRDVAELHAQKAITRFFDKMQATIEQGTSNETEFFAKMSKCLYPQYKADIIRVCEAIIEASENMKAGVDNGTNNRKD